MIILELIVAIVQFGGKGSLIFHIKKIYGVNFTPNGNKGLEKVVKGATARPELTLGSASQPPMLWCGADKK